MNIIRNTNIVINTLQLNGEEARTVMRKIGHYDFYSHRKMFMLYAIWNAVKSIFGKSDWQVARKILESHFVKIVPCPIGISQNEFDISVKKASDLLLTLLTSRQCSYSGPRIGFDLHEIIYQWVPINDTIDQWENKHWLTNFFSSTSSIKPIVYDSLLLRNNNLSFAGLPLKSLPNIFHYPALADRITSLTIKGTFDSFPQQILSLHQLQRLTIEGKCPDLKEVARFTHLKSLHIFDNHLTSFPPEICRLNHLIILRLIGAPYLNSLPPEIGQMQQLGDLILVRNPRLTGLPTEILNLPHTCTVAINESSLSRVVLDNLQRTSTAPGYQGPHFSLEATAPQEMARISVNENLRLLYKTAGKEAKELPNLTQSDNLKEWLNRLSYVGDNRSGGNRLWLVNRVLEILEFANDNVEYRNTFDAAMYSAITCGDSIALTIVKLGINHRLMTFDKRDLKGLAEFMARGIWAMDQLEEIARNKIPQLGFFDEIEVYLGYPFKLKDRLRLPIDIREMLYFNCSALTQTDLDDAAMVVEAQLADRDAYHKFLVSQDVWEKALQNKYPERYQELLTAREQNENQSEGHTNFQKGLQILTAEVLANA